MAGAIVRGQEGEEVEHLQALLGRAGQRVVVDGVYGPRTQAAVAAFLRAQGRVGGGERVDAELLQRLEQTTTGKTTGRAEPVATAPTAAPAAPSDAATGRPDVAGVHAEARALARLICSRRTSAPLSIGLFGGWGAGKSFFMGKLQREIEARCAAFTRAGTQRQADGDAAGLLALQQRWYGRVAQITFNAWHYAEPNLWASLVTRVFDELANLVSPAESLEATRARLLAEVSEGTQRREQAKLELHKAEEQLAEARAERERREAELGQLREQLAVVEAAAPVQPAARGDAEGAAAPEAAAPLAVRGPVAALRVTLRWVWSRGRWTRAAVIGAVVLVVLGAVLAIAAWREWIDLSPQLALATSGMGMAMGVISTLAAWWAVIQPQLVQARAAHAAYVEQRGAFIDRALQDLLRPGESALTMARRRLEEATVGLDSAKLATDQASERLAQARRSLQALGGGQRFYAFVRDRDDGDDYRRHLGLLSMVRDDFARLEQILEQVEREGPGDGELAPLSRIVLYIDDLDRCEPARVVEVLHAVQLLLATPIFVVVVAADVRWLRRSLALHFERLLHTRQASATEPSEDAVNPTPRGYLEKIFQIPLSLRPIDPEGFVSLVHQVARPAMSPAAAKPAATTVEAAELDEDQALALDPAEVALLGRSHVIVTTPRLVETLVHTYRLLRAELPVAALAGHVADGSYRGVLTLLAIQLGWADEASTLLAALDRTPAATLGERLGELHEASGSERWAVLGKAVREFGTAEVRVAELVPWVDRVRRFAFTPWLMA